MQSRFLILTAVLWGTAAGANAGEVAVIANPPTSITALILVGACACIAVCFKVLMLVRGGQLSRSWQLFLAGFSILAISQLGVILHNFGAITMPSWVGPSMLVLMSGIFLYGLIETKRILG
ncbi:MAG: hypothetical protein HY851_11105 [candidate division Zixibacteria bacterium]|nr:hypothetical protein [candidate division Zixibacteria bacterium]